MARSGPVTKDTSTIALGLAQIRIGVSSTYIANVNAALAAADSMGAMASTKFVSNVEYWSLKSGFPQLEDMSVPLSETAALECEFKEITAKNMALARGIDPFASIVAAVLGGTAVTIAGDTVGSITPDDDGGVSDAFTVVFTSATAIAIYGAAEGHIGDFTDLSVAIEPDNGGDPYFSMPANFFDANWIVDETYAFSTVAATTGTAAYADSHAGEIGLGQMAAPAFLRMEAVYTYPNNTNHMYIIFPRANAVSSLELDLQAEDNANPAITFEGKRADSEVDGGHAVWDNMTLGRVYFD